jgi:pyrophosphatase PpaX
MQHYDGIIFDVDGTLTSTNELIFASFNHIAEKYLQKKFSDAEIIKMFGPPEDVIIKEWCMDDYEAARRDYYDFYSNNHHMADLYPGIYDLLKYIKEKGILLSIFTGKGKSAAEITLKKLGVFDYFDMIITGDEVKEHKPSAEGILLFIDKYNLDKEKVLMIGDSPSDIKAAHSAGIKCASVLWDSYAKEKVMNLKTDFLFHSVEELERFIKERI